MSIRIRIILIVVPLFICLLVLTSTISALIAKTGLVEQAVQSYSFKANQFEQYIIDQWKLLEENQLTENQEFVDGFYNGLLLKAYELSNNNSNIDEEVSNKAEILLGINLIQKDIVFSTVDTDTMDTENLRSEINTLLHNLEQQFKDKPRTVQDSNEESLSNNPILSEDELEVQHLINNVEPRSWIEKSFNFGGTKLVGYYFLFPKQNLLVLVSKEFAAFYKPVSEILYYTLALLIFATILSTIIIFRFSYSLVKPLKNMLHSMHRIIESNNFEERVEVLYRDEVGHLSQTFNIMITELDNAYQQIKQYAFSAVVAKKNESKIRNIFQKYVPVNVINSLFQNPTSMLTGENRNLVLMFTDIRSFTTISEKYTPNELVEVLNKYFEKLVDIITNMGGVIDKYIGDAIMAFFGAPVELQNSSLAAVSASIEMIDTLNIFNKELENKGLPKFITGIGINYGLVTIGNIGTEKKMDYTAIGDAVNLGSRLEGLTKHYKQDVIFSQSIRDEVFDVIPCRVVDLVQVKGKTTGEKIYTTTANVNDKNLCVFDYHNQAIDYYLNRDFTTAISLFNKAKKIEEHDFLLNMYIERCEKYKLNPPPQEWDGTEVLTTK